MGTLGSGRGNREVVWVHRDEEQVTQTDIDRDKKKREDISNIGIGDCVSFTPQSKLPKIPYISNLLGNISHFKIKASFQDFLKDSNYGSGVKFKKTVD